MYFVAKPNTEAINFVSAANITDTTQCIAIATLITDLKNYNLWDKMQVIYPFIGGSSGSHGFNLKDPRPISSAFYMTFTGGTHSSTGYQSNGASGYGITNFSPAVNLLNVSSSHISVYVPVLSTADGYDFGTEPFTANGFGFAFRPPYNQLGFRLGGVSPYVSANSIQGYLVGSRLGPAAALTYYTGSATISGADTSTSYGLLDQNLTLGYPVGGGYGGVVRMYSFLTIGSGLTLLERNQLNTAVQRYQTTLGRQV